jgi:hypothetical protein
VLSDLPAYPGWNPFIREARGELAAGERLDLKMQPEGGRAMRFRPTVLGAEPGGSRLVQEERFTVKERAEARSEGTAA